jgi:predicted nucleic acid-binding protein
MRIVADTNVIVSALVFGGVPRRVLELADSAAWELFYSEAI